MTYHEWGDADFDWAALDKACFYVSDRCRQFARCGIWVKEKYGTMRVSTTCAFFTPHSGFFQHLVYPGYVRYMFPRWFRAYLDVPLSKVLGKLGIIRLIQKYQVAVLKYFWKRAAKKWPHIKDEILSEYDWIIGED